MPHGKVVQIAEYRNREIVEYLEQLLEAAKAGEVTGLAFAVKQGQWHATIGTLGDYSVDYVGALGVVARLISFINREAECSTCIYAPKDDG